MPLVVLCLPPLAQKYSSGSDSYDQSIPKGVFNVFPPIKTTHLLYIFLKHMTSFWWFILFFFLSLFFMFSLGSVICKKYTNTDGNVSSMFVLRKTEKIKQKKDPIFKQSIFDSAREKVKRVIRQLEKSQEALENSLYTCFKCRSNNVFSIAKQVTAPDEETSVFNE